MADCELQPMLWSGTVQDEISHDSATNAVLMASGGAIELQGCSLHDSLGSSVALSGTAGARLVDNVIVASRGSSISLEHSTAAWYIFLADSMLQFSPARCV